MPIYLIRHGQSEFNAVYDEGPNDPMIFDPALTDLGRQQAIAARDTVAELGIQHVIVSPLTRALQTASHIFDDKSLFNVTAGPRELLSHSADVGRAPSALQMDFPDISFDHLPDVWWHQGTLNKDGVPLEPRDVFKKRITDFARELDRVTNRPIAVVGHWNTFMELAGFDMRNCEVRRFPR